MNIKNQKGFTLIEILISLLLLAITLVAGIQLFINADKIMTLATHKKIATEVANNKMEEIKTWEYDNVTSLSLQGADGQSVMGGLTLNKNYEVIERDILNGVVGDGINDYKQVTLNLTWDEFWTNDQKKLTLRTNIIDE